MALGLELSALVAVAFAVSWALTPLTGRVATWLNFVDRPDGQHKVHARLTPLGGGLPVLAGVLISVLLALVVPNHWMEYLRWQSGNLLGLLLASLLLCGVGLVDDFRPLRGRQKLAAQIAAVAIMVSFGLRIERLSLFGLEFELGLFEVPFTLFWMLGAINAVNLLDGIDGLAASVGVILSGTVAALAIQTGHSTEAVVALALAGSLLGFLCFNFPPAKIFLGDAGSMLIGLVTGFLAIQASLKGPATVALAAPIAIFAIPIFDSGVAILRRKLTGRSIYHSDLGHLHHCLVRRGCSSVRTIWWIGLLCGFTAAGALVSVYFEDEWLAVTTAMAVVGALLATRVFGYTEFALLASRLTQAVRSLFVRVPRREDPAHQTTVRLQGMIHWEELWTELTGTAERLELSMMQLDVSVPILDEAFHASWHRNSGTDSDSVWHVELPLQAFGRTAGRLRMSGIGADHATECIEQLGSPLRQFRTRFLLLLGERPAAESAPDGQAPQAPREDREEIAVAFEATGSP